MASWNALNEIWPDTPYQRCWMHKMGNVLNRLSKSSQGSAKRDLQSVWQAATKVEVAREFESFKATDDAKYRDAVAFLVKDRETLFTFYDYAAEQRRSLRTTNPIESAVGTIRHRTRQTNGCVSRKNALHMMFKLGFVVETRWRLLRRFERLAEFVEGVKFTDGIKFEPTDETQRQHRKRH